MATVLWTRFQTPIVQQYCGLIYTLVTIEDILYKYLGNKE